MTCKYFTNILINQQPSLYFISSLIVLVTFVFDNDAFAIVYHYEPFFTADGKTVLDLANAQDLRLTSFTVATWFKTTTNFPDEGVMVNKGGLGSESAGGNQNYGIWFTSAERLQGGFETTGGSNKYISSANTYNDGQWHHGVVTFDDAGNIVRLFVDGVQIGTLSTTSTPDNTGSQPLRIAGNAQSLIEDFFVGQIDEVGVWNRALTNTEITSLMNNGVFPSSGLVYNNSFGTQTPEICNDGIDNDGDGKIDAADPDCAATTEICNNGADDDGDGFKDAEDVDSCPPVPEICNNGLDDDRDGLKDAADPDCASPPADTFPVSNIIWTYDSKQTLSNDITIPDGTTHPNDPVLLSSGASGVDSHSIRNGWLEIESGGGNGRVYWNYHELPYFSQLSTAGYNTVMTGTFLFKPGIDNLSIKDGNHGTDGWIFDGQLVFGGFGVAFHRTEIETKAEYWHNRQGSGVTIQYPSGLNLIDNKEYKFFITFRTDRVNQEIVLNAWLDFGNGNGWVKVMTDRKWGLNGWDPGSVPNGNDKADILKGPSFIKKHHIWTRANSGGGVVLPVKDIRIGTIDFIS